MRTIKTIKFNLPINCKRVRNIEELRQNMTPEILELHENGQLGRWLKSRNLLDYHQKIDAIQDISDANRLFALCKIFSIEMSPSFAKSIIKSIKKSETPSQTPHTEKINNNLESIKKKMELLLQKLPRAQDEICNEKILESKLEATDLVYEIFYRASGNIIINIKKEFFLGKNMGFRTEIHSEPIIDNIISRNITRNSELFIFR